MLLQKKATAVLELMHAALLKDWSAEKLLEAVDKVVVCQAHVVVPLTLCNSPYGFYHPGKMWGL